MNELDDELWRLAETVHGQLARRDNRTDLTLPDEEWRLLEKLKRQFHIAQQRQWHLAADRLVPAIASAAAAVCQRLTELIEVLKLPASTLPPANVGDVYRDLVALHGEFDEVRGDFAHAELCVTTAPIVLNGMQLGPFQIRLQWMNLDRSAPYRVVALEPSPAQTNDQVTHPHVSDEMLCEGDGKAAIRSALAGGRIGDFFVLVSQLLHTYAPGRTFVELSNWYGGISCSQCGDSVDDDDRCYCPRCDEWVCEVCLSCCDGCDENYCTGCLGSCDVCGSRRCTGCLDKCESCDAEICEKCGQDERCPRCRKEQSNDELTIEADKTINVSRAPAASAPV